MMRPDAAVAGREVSPGLPAQLVFAVFLVAMAVVCSLPEVHAGLRALAAHGFSMIGVSHASGHAADLSGSVAARLMPAVPVAAAAVLRPGLAGPGGLLLAGLSGDVISGGALGVLALVLICVHLAMARTGRAMTGGTVIAGWARWAAALSVLAACAAGLWLGSWWGGGGGEALLGGYLAGGLMAGLFYPPAALLARGAAWLFAGQR